MTNTARTEAAPDVEPRRHGYDFDLAVFVGRFQPFHRGHLGVVRDALTRADQVLILVGSCNVRRDTRNPFTAEERFGMIHATLDDPQSGIAHDYHRVILAEIPDSAFEHRWLEVVQHSVKRAMPSRIAPRIALTGHERDASSSYLKLFPQWAYIPANDTAIEATPIREAYFEGGNAIDAVAHMLPTASSYFMQMFRGKDEYVRLMDNLAEERRYLKRHGPGPHQTADALVIQSGHVLLIERPDGSYAMPGGFLEVKRKETLLGCAVRELFEETQIEIERANLLATLVGQERFDDPYRSRRGRIITEAFAFHLPADYRLPKVTAADDAKRAFWLPLSEVRGEEMFEDHAKIIEKMLPLFVKGPQT